MVSVSSSDIFTMILKLALVAAAAVYTARVLTSYSSHGLQARPQFAGRAPLRSAGLWGEWLGVKAIALAVEGMGRIFAMLSEASAEVGEWILGRVHHETH